MNHSIFNFSAGPSILPSTVLNLLQEEVSKCYCKGTSIITESHRSKSFVELVMKLERDIRDLLNVPSNYKVLFCQGGARGQFAAVPLNLLKKNKTASYINTGYWGMKAAIEAKKYCFPSIINVRKINSLGIKKIYPMNQWQIEDNHVSYLHYCPNETIEGITIYDTPNFKKSIIVVADSSSIILSSPINVSRYGVIYAASQKNIGGAGLTLVIIREDLLGRADTKCPSFLNYSILNMHHSIFNTPPTIVWYLSSLILKWIKNQGGVIEIHKKNTKNAELLYSVLDSSDFYINYIDNSNRSCMNVPFYLANKKLEQFFFKEAKIHGLEGLKGHHAVGGIRASMYNAMPLTGVEKLVSFLYYFEKKYG